MIREARPEDAVKIDWLYQILLPEHTEVNVTPERITRIAGNADSFLFVYEELGKVVGSAHLHFCMDALSGERPFAVIERVIIAPEFRGLGIGAKLMTHAEEVAANRGALKVMLSSAMGRDGAHLFYEQLGYDGNSSKLFKKYL